MQRKDSVVSNQYNKYTKIFFDQPELYLRNQSQIKIREMITKNFVDGIYPKKILDLGCGDGSISLQFLSNSSHITFVDFSNPMLAIAKKKVPREYSKNVSFIQADFSSLMPTPRFDLVLCVGVLAHVQSVENCIEIISRFLLPGGYCIIQITNSDHILAKFLSLYSSYRNRSGYKVNNLSVSSLLSLFQSYGVHNLHLARYAPLLPGMGLLPTSLIFYYQKSSVKPAFRWISSEVMMLFQKSAPAIGFTN